MMDTVISPDPQMRHAMEKSLRVDATMCWTCSSCVTECPVNILTNRLQPMKIIRMANLGLFDELLRLPEIWYCLSCNRCNAVCPNKVKPADLIVYLRFESIRLKMVPSDMLLHQKDLFLRLHQARWHLAAYCQNGQYSSDVDIEKQNWFERPVQMNQGKIHIVKKLHLTETFKEIKKGISSNACLTCRECSSACPIYSGSRIFDPVSIFRMINLGLIEELMTSPSLWLCISCGRCTKACSQLVKGHRIIEQLQELTQKKGKINWKFKTRFQEKSRIIFTHILDQMDSLLSHSKV